VSENTANARNMASPRQFAVLQKDSTSPTAEQLKRAFRSFNNLTDADAVRLAARAHGILMRHEHHDVARAFQHALQAEGIGAVVVAEDELPKLPDGKSLHRLGISPEAFTVYDLLGRPTAIDWGDVTLVAAAAVRHFEMGRIEKERTVLRFNPWVGVWPKKITESGRTVESGTLLLLEIILAGTATRYQIDAARFPFNHVIDQPGLSTAEKFVWLVREICRHATRAILNRGVLCLLGGQATVPEYTNRQMLTDEMIWLLWHDAHKSRAGGL
jgi:hypothetical protein